MRIGSGILAAIFLLGALVQLNDPDPAVWILAYASASLLSLSAALGKPHRALNIVAAIVFGLWFSSLAASLATAPEEAFTSFRMQAESHEEPREAVGLALLTIWSLALAIWAGASQRMTRK